MSEEELNKITWEEYKRLIEESEITYNELQEANKEIERLKKREQECIDHYLLQCKYASEMEDKYITANNIINELEKCIDERITRTKKEPIREKERNRILYNLIFILDKLQELKGEDK